MAIDATDTRLNVIIRTLRTWNILLLWIYEKLLPKERIWLLSRRSIWFVWTLDKLKSYMFGQEFNLWTDHQALSKTQASESYDSVGGPTWLLKNVSRQILRSDKQTKNSSHQKGSGTRALSSNSWTLTKHYLTMFFFVCIKAQSKWGREEQGQCWFAEQSASFQSPISWPLQSWSFCPVEWGSLRCRYHTEEHSSLTEYF